jgi:hypothetical protein
MTDAFRSPKLTLRRAKHEFESVANGFVSNRPYTMIRDTDPLMPGCEIHKAKFDEFPEMLPCILADAANNLRSALDQCGHISAVVAQRPTKSVKFPFGSCEKEWRNNLTGGCKDLPTEIRAIFERHKAYPGGNNPLWAINEIANAQKHFELMAMPLREPSVFFNVVATTKSARWEFNSPGGFGIGWDSEKREVVLFSVPAGAQTDIQANIAFTIAVDGPQVIRRESAISLLNAAVGEVESVLMGTEAECRRLGFIA